jgi:hypothetical protein
MASRKRGAARDLPTPGVRATKAGFRMSTYAESEERELTSRSEGHRSIRRFAPKRTGPKSK